MVSRVVPSGQEVWQSSTGACTHRKCFPAGQDPMPGAGALCFRSVPKWGWCTHHHFTNHWFIKYAPSWRMKAALYIYIQTEITSPDKNHLSCMFLCCSPVSPPERGSRNCPQSTLGHGIPLKDMNSCPPKVKIADSKVGIWFKRKAWSNVNVSGVEIFFSLVSSVFFSGGRQG